MEDGRLRDLDGGLRLGAAVSDAGRRTIAQILAHSESRLLFVGKLDDSDAMRSGVPAGLPCVRFALSPEDVQARVDMRWDEIIGRTVPLSSGWRAVRRTR